MRDTKKPPELLALRVSCFDTKGHHNLYISKKGHLKLTARVKTHRVFAMLLRS